jgi:hypothetical protein
MKMLADVEKIAGKKPFQVYHLKHGIERISVMVPLSNAQAFEQKVKTQQMDTQHDILTALYECDGQLFDEGAQ